MLSGFLPIISPRTQLLILGSMPSAASLQAQQYYAHPYNQFWKIIFDIFESGRTPLNYQDKKQVLLQHRLGLWDSLSGCERQGSLDSQIRFPQANDFPALFANYPHINKLLFNGQAAFKFYRQAFGIPAIKYQIMPSTSPAHATRTYAQKKYVWQQALLVTDSDSYVK